MSDLLQEIDDALRAEKAEKFWKENGPYFLGGAVLLVLMTGIFTAYDTWKTNRNISQTSLIVHAMQTSAPEKALEESMQDLKGKHKAMAMLQVAGLKAQSGKAEEALKLYQEVAGDISLPSIWRDLATLTAVKTEWGKGVSEARAQDLFNQVKPLTAKDNPWHTQAAIQAAMIAGDNLHDPKTAVELLRGPLSDPNTPSSLKEKARSLDHLYLNISSGHKAGTEKAEPKG